MPTMLTTTRRLLSPPVLLAATALLTWLTGPYPGWVVGLFLGQTSIALILATAGLALIGWAALSFRRAQTTVNPIEPDRATSIVRGGPYGFSRNPMYLADALLLAAWTLYLGAPAGVLWLAVFLCWMDRVQIPAEETALQRRFGADYDRYRQQVRRWL